MDGLPSALTLSSCKSEVCVGGGGYEDKLCLCIRLLGSHRAWGYLPATFLASRLQSHPSISPRSLILNVTLSLSGSKLLSSSLPKFKLKLLSM